MPQSTWPRCASPLLLLSLPPPPSPPVLRPLGCNFSISASKKTESTSGVPSGVKIFFQTRFQPLLDFAPLAPLTCCIIT